MTTRNGRVIGKDVCIVGTGMVGLAAIKNLKEQGLNPTAFTKDDAVGGLWKPKSDVTKLTALEQTSFNTSKQCNAFTDFPMPDEFPTHPPAKDLGKYMEAYAKEFDLHPHIRFSEAVTKVRRDDKDENWLVTTRNTNTGKEETHRFDRLVLATGILNSKRDVDIKGQEKFAGEVIHSREFKDPNKYKGKNVLVVGIGATGADTLVFLKQAGAGKLYSSHRGQYWVLPRNVKGKAFDHSMSRRMGYVVRYIASCSAFLCAWLMGKGLTSARMQAFPFLKDVPAFAPDRAPPSLLSRVPFFSDHLPYYIRDGHVESVRGVREVVGPRSVVLTDGRRVDELDAIIVCTGYQYDLSLLQQGGPGDPTDPARAPDGYERVLAAPHNAAGERFARLYRGFISEQYPESLAVLGHMLMLKGPFVTNDLLSMALASVWSGGYPLPTAAEMRADIDGQYAFVCAALRSAPVPYWGFRLDSRATYRWLNDAAGTGVNERLGSWGWEGWKFWLRHGRLHHLLMEGVDVPAVYRLFETGRGRKPWPGALEHIKKINEEVKQMGKRWEEEQKDDKRKQV